MKDIPRLHKGKPDDQEEEDNERINNARYEGFANYGSSWDCGDTIHLRWRPRLDWQSVKSIRTNAHFSIWNNHNKHHMCIIFILTHVMLSASRTMRVHARIQWSNWIRRNNDADSYLIRIDLFKAAGGSLLAAIRCCWLGGKYRYGAWLMDNPSVVHQSASNSNENCNIINDCNMSPVAHGKLSHH